MIATLKQTMNLDGVKAAGLDGVNAVLVARSQKARAERSIATSAAFVAAIEAGDIAGDEIDVAAAKGAIARAAKALAAAEAVLAGAAA